MDVSIVVPCYNESRYIGRALNSIVKQDFEGSYEIIVVDDGSTDDSSAIAKAFNARVLRYKKNRGIAFARNAGIRKAKGKYISFLSADDMYAPNYLSKMFGVAEKVGNVVLYSDYYMIDENNNIVSRFNALGFSSQRAFALACWNYALRDTMFVNFSTLFGNAKIFKKHKFWEELRYGEDLEWLLRMALIEKQEFFHVPEPLVYYRVHSNSTTSKYIKEIHSNNIKIMERIKKLMEARK